MERALERRGTRRNAGGTRWNAKPKIGVERGRRRSAKTWNALFDERQAKNSIPMGQTEPSFKTQIRLQPTTTGYIYLVDKKKVDEDD